VATLMSVNVGMPADVPWQGRTVHTGVWKRPVVGPRMARRLNIDGDGQGDLAGHGGEQRAVLVYQLDSYRHWQDELGRDDFEFGQFGENFTVDGLSDDEVCIGDRYRIGEAEFEVTQPRVTCFRVGLRMGEPRLPALLVAHHRPGFYLRVISEGRVQAGDEIVRTRAGPHALSVTEVDALLYLPDRDVVRLRAATDVPALSPGWQQSFRELLDGVVNGTQVRPPDIGVEPGWVGFRPLRITRVVAETATVTSLYLDAADGQALPRALPGQYVTLRLVGAGDPAPVRSYSISSGPDETAYRISVKTEGPASQFVRTSLRAGGFVDVAAARGEFVLDSDMNAIVLLSAGIGVTPVLAMLHALADERSEREIWWIHTARNEDEHPFAAEAHELLRALAHAHEHVVYTERSGRLTAAELARLDLPADATAYLCGPEGFMADMRAALGQIGLEPAHVRTELFGARPASTPGVIDTITVAPHQPPAPIGTGPEITFARSGLTVAWAQQFPSLLELAESCDVPTRWSCRTGVCHTCITPVLAGEVRYDPLPLEPPGNNQALICCAQPTDDMVLDL
jgi:ferredoxin-NADP reductase/MOSC domain-containing protein YiiM